MTPNARQLAMRDPARAALLGVLTVASGTNYGAEPTSFGNDFSGGFGDEAPTPQNMALAYNEKMATRARARILRPNEDSSLKVQRYCFAINEDIVVGTASPNLSLTGNPETEFRPQRITINTPAVGFITVEALKVANVGILVGGHVDAYDFSSLGVGQALDVPTLSPANAAKASLNYKGTSPLPLVSGDAFEVSVSFKGPANLAG